MVRQGATKEFAAQACGIPLKVFFRWMSRARTPYGQFRRKILQAEADAIANAERRVFANHAKPWLQRKGAGASPPRSNRNGKDARQASHAPADAPAAFLDDPAWQRIVAVVHEFSDTYPDLAPRFAAALADDPLPAGARKTPHLENRIIPISQTPQEQISSRGSRRRSAARPRPAARL